jgi:hypothetical protein
MYWYKLQVKCENKKNELHIRCRGNVLNEPLPKNDTTIHIQTQRLVEAVYEVRRLVGLRCCNKPIYTNLILRVHRHKGSMLISPYTANAKAITTTVQYT